MPVGLSRAPVSPKLDASKLPATITSLERTAMSEIEARLCDATKYVLAGPCQLSSLRLAISGAAIAMMMMRTTTITQHIFLRTCF